MQGKRSIAPETGFAARLPRIAFSSLGPLMRIDPTGSLPDDTAAVIISRRNHKKLA
jgi:hypothetical protein